MEQNKSALGAALLLGVPLLILMTLLFIVVIDADNAANACAPYGGAVPASGPPPAGGVRVAQANIKQTLNGPQTRADLGVVAASSPDLVSLNEMASRSPDEFAIAGYQSFRPSGGNGQARSTVVAWRTDRWRFVAGGRIVLVDDGPQKWDGGRSATWATVTDSSGAKVSIVSVHHMLNPLNYGPNKPLREQLYASGMARIQQLVAQLSPNGPVFVAGDFNAGHRITEPWAPTPTMNLIGMKSTFDALGQLPTHDGGAVYDYIFFQPSGATATRHWTRELNSDHDMIAADFAFGAGKAQTVTQPVAAKAASAGSLPTVDGFTREQIANAGQIMRAAAALGLSVRDQQIGVMTALGESGLRVLDYGDGVGPDSRGLFQQRDNGAWGSYADRMDPFTSATNFFKVERTIAGRDTMAPTLVAHAVQRNADPYHYQRYWDAAVRIVAAMDGVVVPASASCTSSVAYSDGTFIRPIPGAPVTSGYGPRGAPVAGASSFHKGTDYGAACGTPFHAIASGVVIAAGPASGYGHWIRIDHGKGVISEYGHMYANGIKVSVGQQVTGGQSIGLVGSDGASSGCHLHLTIDVNGSSVDPEKFLSNAPAPATAGA